MWHRPVWKGNILSFSVHVGGVGEEGEGLPLLMGSGPFFFPLSSRRNREGAVVGMPWNVNWSLSCLCFYFWNEGMHLFMAEINISAWIVIGMWHSIVNSFFNYWQDCWYFVRDEEVQHKLEIKNKYGVSKSNCAHVLPTSLFPNRSQLPTGNFVRRTEMHGRTVLFFIDIFTMPISYKNKLAWVNTFN